MTTTGPAVDPSLATSLTPITSIAPAAAAPTGALGAEEARQLDGRLLQGVAWTAAVKWGSQVLQWASTLVVVRHLAPADYGLVGMSTIFVGLVTLFSEFGVGTAVVVSRDLEDDDLRQLNAFAALLGVLGLVFGCLAARPLAAFFEAPALASVVAAMSIGFAVSGLRTVPAALLQRDLAFKRLAFYEGLQAILVAMSMMTMAVLGFGYWTLVVGNVLGALLLTLLVLRHRRIGFRRPGPSVRKAIGLSMNVLVGRLSFFTYSNADFLVAGRMLGASALGVYQFAWTLAYIPVDKISALVFSVTPAVFARTQHDMAGLRRYVLLLTEGLALVTFPVTVGMALTARGITEVVLGPQWAPLTGPLQLLALYASVRSLTPVFPQVLNVVGDARYNMYCNLAAAATLPVAFIIGSRWGTTGIALAWIVIHPPLMLPMYARAFRRLELTWRTYFAALAPAAGGVLVMTMAMLAARRLHPAGWPPAAQLAADVVVSMLAYAGVVLLQRRRLRAFMDLLRAARASS